MLRLTRKSCITLWAFIYILQIVVLGLIIILSVTGPQNNLFPWQMAIGTVLGTALFCGFCLACRSI